MSSFSAGLTEVMPPPQWLQNQTGRLAFRAYPAPGCWLHILISHGFGEHSGWWHHVALALQARGISTYLFDHFHHGRSSGRPGDVASYDELGEGLRMALEKGVAPYRSNAAPLVLMGHSNGGLVALLTLPQLPAGQVAGLVLSSPLLSLKAGAIRNGLLLGRVLSLMSPSIRVPLQTRPWRLTGNRAIWVEYLRDPLRLRKISVRFFQAMVAAAALARRESHRVEVPVLLLSPGRERLVDPDATQTWFDHLEAPHKKQIVYPEMRHELFNEAAWERVVQDMTDWARARFPQDASAQGHAT